LRRPAVVVAGGSVSGLATALALAGHGFPVRVLERSAPPPDPADPHAALERPATAQSTHSHVLTSLGVQLLRERAPQVLEALLDAGAQLLDLTAAAPRGDRPFVREAADDELVTLAVRRPVLEAVLRRAVQDRPGIEVSHGTAVRAVVLDAAGERPVAVVTAAGGRIAADIVVDATGRRSLAGARPRAGADRTGPTTLRAFTRFYRLADPGTQPGPLNRGNAAGNIWGHYAAVLHPADRGTFAVTLGTLPGDAPTAALRGAAAFTAAARLSPGVTQWLAKGVSAPITPVRAITMPANVLRAAPGERDAGGVFAVGDAACVTDPIFGRGMSLALVHAFRLADLLADHPQPDGAQRKLAADLADELLRPWYEQAEHDSVQRTLAWRAAAGGPEPNPAPPLPPGRPSLAEVSAAAGDPVVWRGLMRMLMTLRTPAGVFDDEGFRARVRAAAGRPRPAGPLVPPTRAELLHAVSTGGRGT